MAFPRSIVLAWLLSHVSATERDLSFKLICGYEPLSKIGDHLAIDLDQKALGDLLADPIRFDDAWKIYTKGAHSRSYAELTLDVPVETTINEGDLLTGETIGKGTTTGTALATTVGGINDRVVRFQYRTDESGGADCVVGAYGEIGGARIGDCLQPNGSIEVGAEVLKYSYNESSDNKNGRTLQGFSLQAEKKMYNCDDNELCPHPQYNSFYEYYDSHKYVNEWIEAAVNGRATDLNGKGADFSKVDEASRAESIEKGSLYMGIWMYVLRELWDAVEDCKSGVLKSNMNGVVAWDEAVAFYTGSLEAAGCAKGDGQLLYALANEQCTNFKTCGENGDESIGNSKVNIDIYKRFQTGKQFILKGSCESAKDTVSEIAQLMTIPLVQGTLRYAYRVGADGSNDVSDVTAKATGATFAASVLPLLNGCSAEDADIVFNNMRLGAEKTNFDAVKKAFENNYDCLGITCADVGGLFNLGTDDEYYAGAGPCGLPAPKESTPPSSSSSSTSGSTSLTKYAIFALPLVGLVSVMLI